MFFLFVDFDRNLILNLTFSVRFQSESFAFHIKLRYRFRTVRPGRFSNKSGFLKLIAQLFFSDDEVFQ